jgi:hypothetical protein
VGNPVHRWLWPGCPPRSEPAGRRGTAAGDYTRRPNDRLSGDTHLVMPAKAGIHDFLGCDKGKSWIPAGACPCEGRGRHDEVGKTPMGQSLRRLVLRAYAPSPHTNFGIRLPRPVRQNWVNPPSTTTSDPVMNEASSLARNSATLATSPASPNRCRGICASIPVAASFKSFSERPSLL